MEEREILDLTLQTEEKPDTVIFTLLVKGKVRKTSGSFFDITDELPSLSRSEAKKTLMVREAYRDGTLLVRDEGEDLMNRFYAYMEEDIKRQMAGNRKVRRAMKKDKRCRERFF